MERYICKQCGAEATVNNDGTIIRTCEHNSTIVLEMEVVVTGESNVND